MDTETPAKVGSRRDAADLRALQRLTRPDSRRAVLADLNPDGTLRLRAAEYRDTDRLSTRAVAAANTTVIAELPVPQAHVLAGGGALAALAAAVPDVPDADAGDDPAWRAYYAQEAAAQASYTARDRVLAAATADYPDRLRAAARAGETETGGDDRRPCPACQDRPAPEWPCPGLQDQQLVRIAADGTCTETTTPAVHDASCRWCAGTGTTRPDCSRCGGVGVIATHPVFVVHDPDSGRQARLRVDVPALLANGQAPARMRIASYRTWGEITTSVDLPAALDVLLTVLDAGRDTHLPIGGRNVVGWWQVLAPATYGLRFTLTPAGRYKVGTARAAGPAAAVQHLPDPVTVLEQLADNVVAAHCDRGLYPQETGTAAQLAALARDRAGVELDGHGVAVARHIVLRRRRTTAEAVLELARAAAAAGLTIMLTDTFIATEESGPGVFLADRDGQSLAELSADYEWDVALAGAALALPRALAALADRRGH